MFCLCAAVEGGRRVVDGVETKKVPETDLMEVVIGGRETFMIRQHAEYD